MVVAVVNEERERERERERQTERDRQRERERERQPFMIIMPVILPTNPGWFED